MILLGRRFQHAMQPPTIILQRHPILTIDSFDLALDGILLQSRCYKKLRQLVESTLQ